MAGAIKRSTLLTGLWLIGLLVGTGRPIQAQQRPVHFEFGHIREPEGLTFRSITSMLHDHDGFLWVGTSNGLNRYDGTHFVRFRQQQNNPNSLLNNQVYALCEDKRGHIWAAFENGVSCYTKETGTFRHITTVNNQPLGICKNIICDRAGDVWFTSRNRGLFCYGAKTGAVQYFPAYPTDSTGGIRTLPNGLLEDPHAPGLWMAEIHGLRYFDTAKRQFTSHRNNPKKIPVLTPNDVSALALDGDRLLIADHTNRSILVYDFCQQKIIKHIRPVKQQDRGDFYVASIFVDRRHNLWVNTWTPKSFYIDTKTDQVTALGHDRSEPTSMGSDLIWAGWQHPDGSVWLGTVNGIAHTNPERALYDVYNLGALFPALPDERGIESFVEDTDGSWWLGTSIRGLLRYVPATNQLEVYGLPNKSAEYPWGMPVTGLSLRGNELFVGSGNAVYRFSKKTRQFRAIALPPEAKSVYLRTFRIEGDRYWAFGDGKLAFAYDIPRQQWKTYPIRSASKEPLFLVRQTLIDRKGQFWLDIYPEGFARLSLKDSCFVVTDTRQTDYETFLNSVVEDRDGSFLMATTMHGLMTYDPVSRRDLIRPENESMTLSQCTAALPDRIGNTWVADYNIVSVITPEKQVLNFRLPINEHTISYQTSLFPMRNGHILSAQRGHLVEFKPENLRQPRTRETVLLNRFVLPDTALLLYGDRSTIHLDADDNSFTVEFSVLTVSTKSHYLYKLEGYDEDWKEAGTQTDATYTKLPGGEYTFTVKARSPEGFETPTRTLAVHVATLFYQTTWFRILLGLLVAGLMAGFFRYRTRQTAQIYRLQMQATRLERDKTLIQYQNLINHLNPHFLFNSLTSLNSLILTKPKEASIFLRKLSVIYRYILQNKEKELVDLQDELIFAQNYIDLQTGRFGDGLQISINVPPEYLTRQIVPVTIQNLLENAIKHNVVDDDSPLYIRIYTENDALIVLNTRQTKTFAETSHKQGLVSLKSLYRYLSRREVVVTETATHFSVAVPLL